MQQKIDVPVPMRDGVVLSTDIRLPEGRGPFPVVVVRTPYSNAGCNPADPYIRSGYALVKQDCRGRFDSEGLFHPFVEDHDGYDTLAWVKAQPWCDGRIGLLGNSYCATCQLAAAWTNPPGLMAISPGVMGRDLFKDLVYFNGVFNLSLAFTWGAAVAGRSGQSHETSDLQSRFWHLPLATMPEAAGFQTPHLREWLEHPVRDAYWARTSVERHYPDINVPALFSGGWYDFYAEGTVRNFIGLRTQGGGRCRDRHKLVMGPWLHGLGGRVTGQLDFGEQAVMGMEGLYKQWLDRWVKGEENGADREPAVRYFMMGANEWRGDAEWPPAGAAETPFFLSSGGSANSLIGDGALVQEPPALGAESDGYLYNPAHPVPTMGGGAYGAAGTPNGPTDHSPVERRGDVLVYTSGVLDQPVEVAGFVKGVLHAGSDCIDTDFVMRLCDVYPDGRSIILCDGITRARFREGLDREVFMKPGTVYELAIPMGVTANVFLPGHRIRVEVTSSCFPRFARNLNTGEPCNTGTEMKMARQTIFHSPARPSRILLPVLPPR